MTARSTAGERARFVALLVHEEHALLDDKGYYGPMLQALSDALMEKGFVMRPVQCLHEYQKESFLHGPPRRYAGVVFLGPMYVDKLFIQAVVEHLPGPKVMLDHHFDDIPMHSVREDSVAGMCAAVKHFIELGHRHIAYLDSGDPRANPWKREGVNRALVGAGRPELGRGWVAGCRQNLLDVATALDWFMSLEPRPTAVMAYDDVRALFMLQAAAEAGMRVPDDLSICGYGDVAVRTGRSRALSSVSLDPAEMGGRAAELVAGPAGAKPQAVLVTPRLMARGTTTGPAAEKTSGAEG